MPWKETDPMTECLRCIAANLNQVYSMIDLSASAFAATPATRGCGAIPRQDWRGSRRRAGPHTAAPTVCQSSPRQNYLCLSAELTRPCLVEAS